MIVNKAKQKTVDGFLSPPPGDLTETENDILARVYAEQRKKGLDKEKAAKIAWGAVRQYQEGKKKKKSLIAKLQSFFSARKWQK